MRPMLRSVRGFLSAWARSSWARSCLMVLTAIGVLASCGRPAKAQVAPYDVFPKADPPFYRVRIEASREAGKLIFPVNYTLWVPQGAGALRGIIIHQHGCGEGSCKSGLTGAWDLHWQALAKKHRCALLAPAYEQPEGADCQMWCDPRNGSKDALQIGLQELAKQTGHPELSTVPWALWGHSGGGHWAGGMVMLHPERVVAAWLRSGVPLFEEDPKREGVKTYSLPDAALSVPMMCNLGTQEGVTVTDGRFARVWPANQAFFHFVRSKGGLVSVAVDPKTSHECGNQRYLAIPWLDACLSLRLPLADGEPLRTIPQANVWFSDPLGLDAVAATEFQGDPLKVSWHPNESVAKLWMQYVRDTNVADSTSPPAPVDVMLFGTTLRWSAEADPESGLAGFVIECDGKEIARLPEKPANPFGRPVFQSLQYSDTPTQPLAEMQFDIGSFSPSSDFRVIAVNTVGLKSERSNVAKAVTP